MGPLSASDNILSGVQAVGVPKNSLLPEGWQCYWHNIAI